MDSKMQWFKFYGQDWLTDLKIITMEPIDRLIYVYLMCYGSVSEIPGKIRRCKEDALLKIFQLNNVSGAHGCLTRLELFGVVKVTKSNEDGFLDIDLVNFRKRQERALTARERQALYRDRKRDDSNEEVTESNCDVTDVTKRNESVTLEESREEKNRGDKKRGDKKRVEKKNTGTKFSPPSIEEVKEYCTERKNSIDPQRFIDYYEAKGWVIGRSPMKNWKAAMRANWEGKTVEQKVYQAKKK